MNTESFGAESMNVRKEGHRRATAHKQAQCSIQLPEAKRKQQEPEN
jgi:hypothetical protein